MMLSRARRGRERGGATDEEDVELRFCVSFSLCLYMLAAPKVEPQRPAHGDVSQSTQKSEIA